MVIALGEPWRFSAFFINLSGSLAPLLSDEGLQHLALAVHHAPEAVLHAVDADVDHVQVPAPVGVLAHTIHPLAPNLSSENGAKPRPRTAS